MEWEQWVQVMVGWEETKVLDVRLWTWGEFGSCLFWEVIVKEFLIRFWVFGRIVWYFVFDSFGTDFVVDWYFVLMSPKAFFIINLYNFWSFLYFQ